jgi:hypothetical protein
VHSHLILTEKKKAWYLTFTFLPSSPSDQAQQLISAAATTELVTPSHSNSRVSSSKSEQQQRGFLFCNLGHWFWFGPMTQPFFLKVLRFGYKKKHNKKKKVSFFFLLSRFCGFVH